MLLDVGFEEEGEEEEEELNMMNNSLLQVYRGSNMVATSPDVTSGNQDSIVSDSHSGSQEDSFWNEMEPAMVSTPNSRGSLETEVPFIIDERGSPIAVIDTSSTVAAGTLLSNLTADDSHVTPCDGHVTPCDSHVTADENHMTGTQTFGSVRVHPVMSSTDEIAGSESVCSGASWEGVREGRGEVGGGGTESGERHKLKKVTFAPDVVDKQSASFLKVGVSSC